MIDYKYRDIDLKKLSEKISDYDLKSQEYIILFAKKIKWEYLSEKGKKVYKRKIKYVDFMITNRCNLNCIHCSSRYSNDNIQILNKKEILNVIDFLSYFKLEQIVITGGEPLIVENIDEILKYIRNKFKSTKIILSTNGILIDKYIDSIIRNVDGVNISLDGYEEEITNEIRGVGVFNKVINNIKLLQKRDFFNIKTSMVMLENNEKEMGKFVDLNNNLKTEYIFRMLCNVGRAEDNKDYFREKNFAGYPVANFLLTSGIKQKKDLNIRSCNAYNEKIYINHDGKIYPCPSLKIEGFEIADIKNKRFSKDGLLKKMDNLEKEFLNIKKFHSNSKCENCFNKIFCWTCPADFIIAKNNNEINELCDVMKNRIEELFI